MSSIAGKSELVTVFALRVAIHVSVDVPCYDRTLRHLRTLWRVVIRQAYQKPQSESKQAFAMLSGIIMLRRSHTQRTTTQDGLVLCESCLHKICMPSDRSLDT